MSRRLGGRVTKYSDDFKRKLVAESHIAGVSVPMVAKKHGGEPNRIGSVAKFDCVFALGQCCAILFSKKPKAGTIHDG